MTEVARTARATLDAAPPLRIRQGRYELRFARTPEELDDILHLRFNVFNLELGEGLQSSFATRRDQDAFDLGCHHLLVEDVTSGSVVGTYRMQTWEMASRAAGFYSAGEFTLDSLPPEILRSGVEVGRACIVREHRGRPVLFLLWKGLAAYLVHFGKRYLFGCCSLSTQDPVEGQKLLRQLESQGRRHPELVVGPRPGHECVVAAGVDPDATEVTVPPLFATYLRYGALVCGPPAIDREFKTIDYFVILDVNQLDPRTFRAFFGAEPAR